MIPGGYGVPSPALPPGAGRGGRVPGAPASGRGPRGSGPLRLARQRWRWRRGEGGGLSQEGRWRGDWPTEVRGRRRAAAIRKNVRRHARVRLLLPLLHSPGPAPGPVPGAAVPVRGMGVGAEGRWFPTAGRRWRWRRGGSRWTQGRGDGRAPRAGGLGGPGKEEVCL